MGRRGGLSGRGAARGAASPALRRLLVARCGFCALLLVLVARSLIAWQSALLA